MPVARRQRKSVVVWVGDDRAGDGVPRALAGSLSDCGIEAVYLGAMDSASGIAASVAGAGADAVEVCVAGDSAPVPLLRELLREFRRLGRGSTTIVVHRVQ